MKPVILLVLFFFQVLAGYTQVTKTVTTTSGNLEKEFSADELKSVTNLIIQGTMDARDFKAIRDKMPALTYLDLKSVAVNAYTGSGGTVYYSQQSYPANTIPNRAFSDKTKINTIILPEGIVSIQDYAFQSCTNLKKLELPNSIEKLGTGIFMFCDSLHTIIIPSSLKEIGDYVFNAWRGLKYISLPSSITSIGKNAFSSCINLQSIEIPVSVESIGNSAFSNCSRLDTVSLPASLNSIGDMAFYLCSQLKAISIPDSTRTIGTMAFYKCANIDEFYIPAKVTMIGRLAFTETRADISVDPFNPWYSSLEGILFNKQKDTLIHCPIDWKGLYEVPLTVKVIGEGAFSTCDSLSEVRLPSILKSIHEKAFYKCKGLSSMNLPESVSAIGKSAFDGSSGIESIIIPDSVKSVSNQTFYGCSGLKTVQLPANLKSIGVQAFGFCTALQAPDLPETLRTINTQAFYNCKSFDTLMIPASVDTLGSHAFSRCTALKSFYVFRKVPVDLYNFDNVFMGVDNNVCKLFVPFGTKTAYSTEYQWEDFRQIVEMPGFKLSTHFVYLYGSVDSYSSVTINANVPWTATADQSWVKVIPDGGTDSTSILIIAEKYGNPLSRTATITVTSPGMEPEIITVIQQPLIANVRKFDVLECYGAATGMINFYNIIGTNEYEFSIDGGASWKADTTFTELPAGTYHTRIRDSNDTIVDFSLGAIVLTEPKEMRAWVDGLYTIYCGSYHPGVQIYQPRGGSGSYEYSFDGGVTWRTEPNFWEVWGPQWIVVMMRDAEYPDCAVVLAEGEIMYIEPIFIEAEIAEIDLSQNRLGSIDLTIYGGYGQYEFRWSTGETTEDIEDLMGGYYNVEIFDYNTGCVETQSYYLNIPPNADAGSDQIVSSGANVSLDGSGSSDPENDLMTFHWTAPDGVSISDPESRNPSISLPDVDKLTIFKISLVVNDGKTDSYPSEVMIIVCPAYQTEETIDICEGESYQGYTVSGTYTRMLKSMSGCDSTVITNLFVHPDYTPAISVKGDTLSASGDYLQYQWYNEAGPIGNEADSVFIISSSGIYFLEVVDEFGCTHTSDVIQMIFSDAPIIGESPFDYTIYPNPNAGEFVFQFTTTMHESYVLMLLNPLGQCVETRRLEVMMGVHTCKFSVSHLSKGFYFLKINGGRHQVVEKIVVQ